MVGSWLYVEIWMASVGHVSARDILDYKRNMPWPSLKENDFETRFYVDSMGSIIDIKLK